MMRCRGILLCSTLAALLGGGSRSQADIIAVENGTPDVLRFTSAGAQSTFATTNLDSPIGVTVGPGNNVYVVNNGTSNSVAEYSATGTPLGFFVTNATPPGNTLNAPVDIAFDGTGNAYVTNGTMPNPPYGYVAQYTSAGAFTQTFGTANTNMPTGIGYNPANGLLYIVNSAATGDPGPNTNSFLIYNPANIAAAPTIVTPTGAGMLDGGQQVAFDPTGHVFIASNGTTTGVSMIQEYSATGAYIATIDTVPGGNAEGVTYDPTTNTLYASFLGGGAEPTSTSGFIEKYVFNGATFDPGVLFASGLNFPTYLATLNAVPEPTSVVLMGLGVLTIVGVGARRTKLAA